MARASMFSAGQGSIRGLPIECRKRGVNTDCLHISLQFIGVFWVTLLLSPHGNAQITQIGNI